MTIHRITSTSNDLVKHAAKLQKDKSYRISTERVLVEGKNLLLDLVKKHTPERIFLTEPLLPLFQETFAKAPQGYDGDIFIIEPFVAQKISLLDSPEGCFAEYLLPRPAIPKSVQQGLVLDRLQDPGNIGTLLRTALAFGIQAVFCIEPCCDVWNPKVIRSAKGAQFDVPVISTSWNDLHQSFPNLILYVADLKGEDIRTISPTTPWLLVLGNEAHGASLPSNLPQQPILIPMSSHVESLNVAQAGAIALYCLTSQKM